MKKHKFIIRYLSLVLSVLLGSCVNDPMPDYVVEEKGVRYSTFDYVNAFDCQLNIEAGRRAFVYIFTERPGEDNGATPIRSVWTDGAGHYTCELHLPTAMIGKPLYAMISGEVYTADVTAKGVSISLKGSRDGEDPYDIYGGEIVPEYMFCKKLVSDYQERIPSGSTSSYDNINLIGETGNIPIEIKSDNTQVLFTFLNTNGWNTNFVYYYYYKDSDPIEDLIDEAYLQQDCRTKQFDYSKLKEFAERFCVRKFQCTREWGIEKGADGWGANPDKDAFNGSKPCINDTCSGGINRNFNKIMDEDHQVTSNMLYFYGENYDEEGVDKFPKGYKIGFILKSLNHSKRLDPSYNNSDACFLKDENVNYYFTNPVANKPVYDGNRTHATRFWASSKNDDANKITRFLYGYEDAVKLSATDKNNDRNFGDFMFLISTNPKASTDKVRSLTGTFSCVTGTLLFEDLYPIQGDYDMNDVIVEYRVTKEYYEDTSTTTPKSYVQNLSIDFYPLHYGATYDDYLYVRLKDGSRSIYVDFEGECGMTLKQVANYNERMIAQGRYDDVKSVTVNLITDFKTYYDTDYRKLDSELPYSMIDPFIYVKDTQREVHLTGYSFAGVRDATDVDLDENQRKYRAPECNDGSGYYPWAMDIPIKTDAHHAGFVPVSEGKNILTEYLQFGEWVSTLGKKATDWYHYKY